MIINEKVLLQKLNRAKKVLLIEPSYTKKYPPLGLAKIKAYLSERGTEVKFSDHIIPEEFDLIGITTLFTYYAKQVYQVIQCRGFHNLQTPIIVGGVFASIMPKAFDKEYKVDVFRGYSKELDSYIPDKDIMNSAEKSYWNDFSYVFTTRGCPNSCPYCLVWRIETPRWINTDWKNLIDLSKPYMMISDNNLSAAPEEHLTSIIDFVIKHNKKVLFNNGFDCKYITKEMAGKLAKLKYLPGGMRIAFDRIEEDGVFQTAVEHLLNAGVSPNAILSFVLFNFNDRPQDAYYRARVCADYKIRPYPQYYRPLNILSKKELWIGKHWTLRLGRTFRYYWLMRGIFSKIPFDEYLHSKEAKKHHHLTNADILMYDNNGST